MNKYILKGFVIQVLILFLLGALCVWVFWPGLTGGFWLDDAGVLPRLFEDFEEYGYQYAISNGNTGPLGRPLSLLSFLLQADSWPEARPLILVNILIHALNAILLFGFLRLLLPLLFSKKVSKPAITIFSLLVAITWACAPIQVSSVLYIVQRMTLLSSTFTLLALIFLLLSYREALAEENSAKVYIYIFLAGFAGLLGLLAKESGFTLVFFSLALVLSLHSDAKGFMWRRVVPLVIFSSILSYVVYLSFFAIDDMREHYSLREFDIYERLMTQGRVVWIYAQQTLFPITSKLGLYHDDIVISRSLLSPWTTILSIFMWLLYVLVLIVAFFKRWKLLVFLLVWYAGGHLLESTVIPLELYFEHRNYLPSVALFIAFAFGAVLAYQRAVTGFVQKIMLVGGGAYLVFMLGLSHYVSGLWGDLDRLSTIYATERPNSIRARYLLVDVFQRGMDAQSAYKELGRIEEDFPESIAVKLVKYEFACVYDWMKPEISWDSIHSLAEVAKYSSAALASVEQLGKHLEDGACDGLNDEAYFKLLDAFMRNPNYYSVMDQVKTIKAQIYFNREDYSSALENFQLQDYQSLKMRVVILSMMGRVELARKEALELTSKTKFYFKVQSDKEFWGSVLNKK